MGSARKLQSEIDRTLKKVQEGIDVFDQIWNKVYDTENASQKEKYEGDLKKEIKKLQRYRDQIKTWAASNDIKDKKPLLDARKQIEREMERFKVCEKETKTKAFSKEGLGQAAKMDPKDKAKMEMRDWLNNTVETLSTQIDEFEFEMEGLTSSMKKNKPPPRLSHLEDSVVRHKEHVRRLEQMLRLLDNETISIEEVQDVKDLVEDYLDRNQDDFEEFDSPDDIYFELLDKLDAANALDAVPAPVAVADKKTDKKADKAAEKEREAEREAERKRERDRQAAAALKSQVRGLPPVAPVHEETADKKAAKKKEEEAVKKAVTAAAPAAAAAAPATVAVPAPSRAGSAPVTASTPGRPEPPEPASRAASGGYGAAAAAGAAAQQPQQQPQPQRPGAQTPPPGPGPGGAQQGQQPGWMYPAAAAAEQGQQGGPPQAQQSAPQSGFPQLTGESRRAEILPDQKNRYLSRYQQVQQNVGKVGMIDPATGQLKMPPGAAGQDAAAAGTRPMMPPGMDGGDSSAGPSAQAPPGGLDSNGIVGAGNRGDMAAEMGVMGGPPVAYGTMVANQQLLQSCAQRSIPQPGDSTWTSYPPRVRAPQGVTIPPSYPSAKLPILENPALFEKLDSEALFFAFYHQPGSYQQYLAARELKRQSWRYHKVHGAWFQRHEEPTAITDEYEQGTYVYFDYNILHDDMQGGWCYRLKQDFTFEYEALEDELVV